MTVWAVGNGAETCRMTTPGGWSGPYDLPFAEAPGDQGAPRRANGLRLDNQLRA